MNKHLRFLFCTAANKSSNNVVKLEQRLFKELQIKEREHLQEWIAKNPEMLGEELLIIHDGTSAYITEYAVTRSGLNLSTFDADVSGGNLRLLVTPLNAVTIYKATCTGIRD